MNTADSVICDEDGGEVCVVFFFFFLNEWEVFFFVRHTTFLVWFCTVLSLLNVISISFFLQLCWALSMYYMTLQVMQHVGFFKSLGFAHLRILSFSDSVLIDDVCITRFCFCRGKRSGPTSPALQLRKYSQTPPPQKKQLSALSRRWRD